MFPRLLPRFFTRSHNTLYSAIHPYLELAADGIQASKTPIQHAIIHAESFLRLPTNHNKENKNSFNASRIQYSEGTYELMNFFNENAIGVTIISENSRSWVEAKMPDLIKHNKTIRIISKDEEPSASYPLMITRANKEHGLDSTEAFKSICLTPSVKVIKAITPIPLWVVGLIDPEKNNKQQILDNGAQMAVENLIQFGLAHAAAQKSIDQFGIDGTPGATKLPLETPPCNPVPRSYITKTR